MTPDRLAEIRAVNRSMRFVSAKHVEGVIVELADALEQAWAERDDQIRQAEIQAHLALDAEAALARIRGLCAEQMGCDHLIRASDIRAAIDGGAE